MFFTFKSTALSAILFLSISSVAVADERYGPIQNKTVSDECGACHMAFQPQMLPKRSWIKIMEGLSDHFGEDASLDAKTADEITSYLVENAADSSWWGGKFMRGIKDHMTPVRITQTPYWIREHKKEVPARTWKTPRVGSKANCLACHRDANRGNYDDD